MEIAEKLSQKIIERLETQERVSSEELVDPKGTEMEYLHGVLLSLASKERIIFELEEVPERTLTAEGREFLEKGSHEYRLYKAIGSSGSDEEILKENPHGALHAFKNKWIKKEGGKVYRSTENIVDSVVEALSSLTLIGEKEYAGLKRRGLVSLVRHKVYYISRGPAYNNTNNLLSELTSGIVANYQGERFKKYNFESIGNIPHCGALHPLLKMRSEIRQIFLEMGFAEMNTRRYVESSFWNFDTLFQPQNHPSRDAHDTFFTKSRTTRFEDEDYLQKVKLVHEKGGYGSIGHGGTWSREEAEKNILRTHTTAISSRNLASLAKAFQPIKLFSIDKVFRNESVDATHLAEFHQVEGFIAGYDIAIGDLMGILEVFFKKLGLSDVRFKPAFNPYTEPSMEIFGWHDGLGRWIEIGNSGIFRPEMLGPMGYPSDVTVIAWGLSLERPAMIKYGLKNIRNLVGHKVDIDFIRKSSFVIFK